MRDEIFERDVYVRGSFDCSLLVSFEGGECSVQ